MTNPKAKFKFFYTTVKASEKMIIIKTFSDDILQTYDFNVKRL